MDPHLYGTAAPPPPSCPTTEPNSNPYLVLTHNPAPCSVPLPLCNHPNPHLYGTPAPPPHHHDHHLHYSCSYSTYPYPNHGGCMGHDIVTYRYPPAASMTSCYHGAAATGGVEGRWAGHPLGHGVVRKNVKRLTFFEDLETKNHKLIKGCGVVDSMSVCPTCNVRCNSDAVFAYDLAGGKRAREEVQIEYCEVCDIQYQKRDHNAHYLGKKHTKNMRKLQESTAAIPVSASSSTATKEVQIEYCEVCDIQYQKRDHDAHYQGKKHTMNMRKVQESTATIPVAEAGEKTADGWTEALIGAVIAAGSGPVDEVGKRKPLTVTAGSTVLYSK